LTGDGVKLTDEDLARLDAILPYAAAGNRIRDMKRVNA